MSKARISATERVVRMTATPPRLTREEARAIALRRLAEMTDEEDARLTEAALADADNTPLDPARRRPGRPPAAAAKQLVSLRLDRDVVAALRASGEGWQTRVNDTLRKTMGLE